MSQSMNKTVTNRSKPYDKSRHYKKHIGNKSEGQGFAELRKQKIKRGYFKLMQKQEKREKQDLDKNVGKDTSKSSKTDYVIKDDYASVPGEKSAKEKDKKEKLNRFSKAKEEFEKKKQEELTQKEEALKEKEARDEALRKYHQKKNEKHNKFKIRTSKGQPVMKYRMQDLLQQIQTMKSENKL